MVRLIFVWRKDGCAARCANRVCYVFTNDTVAVLAVESLVDTMLCLQCLHPKNGANRKQFNQRWPTSMHSHVSR